MSSAVIIAFSLLAITIRSVLGIGFVNVQAATPLIFIIAAVIFDNTTSSPTFNASM